MSAETAPQPTNLRHISNSEVSTWLSCQRKYYYNFDLNLAPHNWGQSMSRGLLGHEILAVYYTILKDGGTHAEAIEAAEEQLALAMSSGKWDLDITVDVARILGRYWPYAARDNWEILAVESKQSLQLTDEYDLTLRLDLLVREPAGNLAIVDHKFVYDFYSSEAVQFMPQLPKYLTTLNFNGLHVERGIINQLRWRMRKNPPPMTDEELFKRSIIKPSDNKQRSILREQIMASRQIVEHRRLPIEVRERSVLRHQSKMNCQNCSYRMPCLIEQDGGDASHELELNFIPNDYDYNSGETE